MAEMQRLSAAYETESTVSLDAARRVVARVCTSPSANAIHPR
jgi:hypothetical protein